MILNKKRLKSDQSIDLNNVVFGEKVRAVGIERRASAADVLSVRTPKG